MEDRNRVVHAIDETGHPSDELLTEYREDLLPVLEDELCEAHVTQCGVCQNAIRIIAARIEHNPEPCFIEGE